MDPSDHGFVDGPGEIGRERKELRPRKMRSHIWLGLFSSGDALQI